MFNVGDTVFRGTRGRTPTHVVVSTNSDRMTLRSLTDGTESVHSFYQTNGWRLYQANQFHFWTRDFPHVPAMDDVRSLLTGENWQSKTAMFGCGV